VQSSYHIEQSSLRLIDIVMDKEINDLLDEIHADVQRYEQQQHQQQEPEDVDLNELMFEMNEFVDHSHIYTTIYRSVCVAPSSSYWDWIGKLINYQECIISESNLQAVSHPSSKCARHMAISSVHQDYEWKTVTTTLPKGWSKGYG